MMMPNAMLVSAKVAGAPERERTGTFANNMRASSASQIAWPLLGGALRSR